jgi:glutamyl-tRNA synthetase
MPRPADERNGRSAPPASPPPIGRLAPSPTGPLHVGHARTFLLAWWHARSRGGRVVLRLEDLDHDRSKPGMALSAIEDLEWLGLDWDGAPIVQSTRTELHDQALERLVAAHRAYPCTCTRKEIQLALSAPHAGEPTSRYPGTCRNRFATPAQAEHESGRPAALRFALHDDEPPVRFDDAFAGPYTADVAADVGDFPIARKTGEAAYQLAVVVDDALDHVTEIVRGDDLLPSTGQQILLQQALDLPHPRWYHVPLVVDEGARRLAKRSDAQALARLRTDHVDPRALVAWIARRSGIDAPPRATAAELVPAFDMRRVPPTPIVFGQRELEELLRARAS